MGVVLGRKGAEILEWGRFESCQNARDPFQERLDTAILFHPALSHASDAEIPEPNLDWTSWTYAYDDLFSVRLAFLSFPN